MEFHLETAEIFVPDNLPVQEALARTTHLAVSAHQDDIEIMAARPILECFQQNDLWFTGVVVADGQRFSPRAGVYERYKMRRCAWSVSRSSARQPSVGEYAAQIMLDYPSKTIKDGSR